MSDLAYSIRLPQGDYPLTRAGDEYQERYVYDSECYGGQGDVKYAILENGVLQLHRKQGNGHVPCWQGRCIGIVGRYTQVQEFNEYNQKDLYPQVEVVEGIAASPISAALDERLAVVKPVCEACPEYRGMKGTYVVNCRARSGGCCGGVSVNFGCPKGYWDKTLYAKGMFDIQKITKQTDPHVITDIILNNDGWRNPGLPYGWQNWPNIQEAYRWALSGVKIGELKPSSGRGICILAGGKYFAGGYASIRQIRATGCELPIELWLLPGEELTVWQQKAIEGLGVTPRVVVDHVCGSQNTTAYCTASFLSVCFSMPTVIHW